MRPSLTLLLAHGPSLAFGQQDLPRHPSIGVVVVVLGERGWVMSEMSFGRKDLRLEDLSRLYTWFYHMLHKLVHA